MLHTSEKASSRFALRLVGSRRWLLRIRGLCARTPSSRSLGDRYALRFFWRFFRGLASPEDKWSIDLNLNSSWLGRRRVGRRFRCGHWYSRREGSRCSRRSSGTSARCSVVFDNCGLGIRGGRHRLRRRRLRSSLGSKDWGQSSGTPAVNRDVRVQLRYLSAVKDDLLIRLDLICAVADQFGNDCR
jgi:hypothetical protein